MFHYKWRNYSGQSPTVLLNINWISKFHMNTVPATGLTPRRLVWTTVLPLSSFMPASICTTVVSLSSTSVGGGRKFCRRCSRRLVCTTVLPVVVHAWNAASCLSRESQRSECSAGLPFAFNGPGSLSDDRRADCGRRQLEPPCWRGRRNRVDRCADAVADTV